MPTHRHAITHSVRPLTQFVNWTVKHKKTLDEARDKFHQLFQGEAMEDLIPQEILDRGVCSGQDSFHFSDAASLRYLSGLTVTAPKLMAWDCFAAILHVLVHNWQSKEIQEISTSFFETLMEVPPQKGAIKPISDLFEAWNAVIRSDPKTPASWKPMPIQVFKYLMGHGLFIARYPASIGSALTGWREDHRLHLTVLPCVAHSHSLGSLSYNEHPDEELNGQIFRVTGIKAHVAYLEEAKARVAKKRGLAVEDLTVPPVKKTFPCQSSDSCCDVGRLITTAISDQRPTVQDAPFAVLDALSRPMGNVTKGSVFAVRVASLTERGEREMKLADSQYDDEKDDYMFRARNTPSHYVGWSTSCEHKFVVKTALRDSQRQTLGVRFAKKDSCPLSCLEIDHALCGECIDLCLVLNL